MTWFCFYAVAMQWFCFYTVAMQFQLSGICVFVVSADSPTSFYIPVLPHYLSVRKGELCNKMYFHFVPGFFCAEKKQMNSVTVGVMLDRYSSHTSVILPVSGDSHVHYFSATKKLLFLPFREKLSIGMD